MTVELCAVAAPDVPWDELDRSPDRTIGQSRPWLDFLAETQGAVPLLARVVDDGADAGWFTGATVRRYGVPILGSPLRGWTTGPMGFNLAHEVDGRALLAALTRFADHHQCAHVEVMDRWHLPDPPYPSRYRPDRLPGYRLDLRLDLDALLGAMSTMARRNIRTADSRGLIVEEVEPADDPEFALRYYEMVTSTFERQGLVPPYDVDRVRSLIRHLHPTGRLLLLRALAPDGTVVAQGLFPGLPGSGAGFWMGASRAEHHHLRPNEALMWRAITTWRSQGASWFEFGGGGAHKAKYGGTPEEIPWLRASRFALLEAGRNQVRRRVRRLQVRNARG